MGAVLRSGRAGVGSRRDRVGTRTGDGAAFFMGDLPGRLARLVTRLVTRLLTRLVA